MCRTRSHIPCKIYLWIILFFEPHLVQNLEKWRQNNSYFHKGKSYYRAIKTLQYFLWDLTSLSLNLDCQKWKLPPCTVFQSYKSSKGLRPYFKAWSPVGPSVVSHDFLRPIRFSWSWIQCKKEVFESVKRYRSKVTRHSKNCWNIFQTK